jgi:hypothetical protein|tara:strand:+ start:76 stop:423 length:348 start_codon:yes stop_codon:yes gene_type:complete
MKNKITILLLFIATSVSAQLEKFEGFWYSNDTSYNVLIIHNDYNDLLTIDSFSFENNFLVKESIKHITDDELTTISMSEDNWSLLIKYTVINDTIMKAALTGSITTTLTYKKLFN